MTPSKCKARAFPAAIRASAHTGASPRRASPPGANRGPAGTQLRPALRIARHIASGRMRRTYGAVDRAHTHEVNRAQAARGPGRSRRRRPTRRWAVAVTVTFADQSPRPGARQCVSRGRGTTTDAVPLPTWLGTSEGAAAGGAGGGAVVVQDRVVAPSVVTLCGRCRQGHGRRRIRRPVYRTARIVVRRRESRPP